MYNISEHLKFILFIKVSMQFKFHISVLNKHLSIEISLRRQVAWKMKLRPIQFFIKTTGSVELPFVHADGYAVGRTFCLYLGY